MEEKINTLYLLFKVSGEEKFSGADVAAIIKTMLVNKIIKENEYREAQLRKEAENDDLPF